MKELSVEFLSQSVTYLNENSERISKCLEKLTDAEVWQKPNDSTNSIGNLILHLSGNITQWVLSSIGGKPDARIREEEFSASGGLSVAELRKKNSATVEEAISVIERAEVSELMRERDVQGFKTTGVGIIIHVVEHYSYHTGQIALITKLLKNQDLGFYSGVDLNKHNP